MRVAGWRNIQPPADRSGMHFASLLWNSATFDVMTKHVRIVANSLENDIIMRVSSAVPGFRVQRFSGSEVQEIMVNNQ